jgi:Mn-dependent DtxR family transcriptional regulator
MEKQKVPKSVSASLAGRVLAYLRDRERDGVADVRQIDIANKMGISETSVSFAIYHLDTTGQIIAERYRGGMRYHLKPVLR